MSKAYKILDEKVQKSYLSWQWRSNAKFEEKLDFGFKNYTHGEFGKFYASSGKSENLHFDVLLLSIAYKFSAKKSAEELS